MEYCVYKDIDSYSRVNTISQMDEIKFFISDITTGLEYIYNTMKMHHYNLYPSNILLTKDPAYIFPKVKLSNYGMFEVSNDDNAVVIYNYHYSPPEYILNEKYHDNSDVWCFGMIIYRLFLGCLPPEIENDPYTALAFGLDLQIDELIEGDLVKSLLKQMLRYNPDERITMDKVFKHPFIKMCKDCKYGTLGKKENYELISPLGKGGFANVILAKTEDGTKVAIKEAIATKDREQSMIKKEASCMRLCKHPNLVEYKDMFVYNKSLLEELFKLDGEVKKTPILYLVMEYCDCGTLEDYVKDKDGVLSNDEIQTFLSDISSGLWYLHYYKQLIHRDLKPSNLLLKSCNRRYPRVKISDYGLSHCIIQLLSSDVGSKLFQSPEIFRHDVYTSKCDLYSLGVILFYMATKRYPFGDNYNSLILCLQYKEEVFFPKNIEIDEDLKDLILKLVTHYEKDRLSWKEFFSHPYVIQSLNHYDVHIPTSEDFTGFGEF